MWGNMRDIKTAFFPYQYYMSQRHAMPYASLSDAFVSEGKFPK
jgi:hypothetical protein